MNGGTSLLPTVGSPKDPVPVLQKRIELLEGEVRLLHRKLQSTYRKLAEAEGKDQQQALDELLKELRKAEEERLRAERAQLETPLSEESDSKPEPVTPRKGHGPRPQPRLRTVEEIFELTEQEQSCEKCGGDLVPLGESFEEYEEITVIGREYVQKIVKRRKYRCRCNGCVKTAPAPPRLVPGGRYDLDFAVQVAVDKYLDHIPLERQTRIMDRLGLTVDSQTLWDQIEALERVLAPVYTALGSRVLEAPVLHADETRWPRLDSKHASNWTVWTRCTPDIAHYAILGSKSTKAARSIFSGYSGIVVADGYQVYERLARDGPNLRLANCWAHTRRKFEECRDSYPAACAKILKWIGQLYEIEYEVSGRFPGDEKAQSQRRRLREEKSRPIIQEIHDWATMEVGLPNSELGKAVRYLLARWKGFTLFLENPLVPLDNNAAERSLRGPVVGRKVHYGSKSKRGTEVAATFYTLLETAKLCEIEPARYLKSAAETALQEPGTILLPHDMAS